MNEEKREFKQIDFDDTGVFLTPGSVIEFESSNFKRIVYNGDGTLDVAYNSGLEYRYFGVPPSLFYYVKKQVEKGSKTIGQELHLELVKKSDIYPYKRIT